MIYTFGHSTLSFSDGVNLLRDHNIKLLVDIRSHPTSRFEQWRNEHLEVQESIQYEWFPALGGWRADHFDKEPEMAAVGVDLAAYAKGKFPKQRIGVDRTNAPILQPSWTNQGLYDYSWFTATDEFLDGLDKLVEAGTNHDIAIMCAEVLWWKCHRSMVADVLWELHGVSAIHLQPQIKHHEAALGNRIERYDPRIRDAWKAHQAR